MRARLTLIGAAAALMAAGCGGGQSKTGSTGTSGRTAPPGSSTAPGQPAGPILEETGRPADAAAIRVIRGWTDAQRASDVDRATSYFAVPAVVENGAGLQRLPSRSAVRAFNAALPCGAVLLRTSKATQPGFTVATFRLVNRPGRHCDGVGAQARTAFGVRTGRIRAWVRISDRPRQGGTPAPQPPPPQPGSGGRSSGQSI